MAASSTDNDTSQNKIKVLLNPPQCYFDQLQKWISKTDRWNYRKEDYCLWQRSYDSFWLYLAVDEENDQVVSSISLALQYDSDRKPLYSIGNYYCVPRWRGKGISGKLFSSVMRIIGDENATLYSTSLVSDFYANRGHFKFISNFWYDFGEIRSEDIVIPKIQNEPKCSFKSIDDSYWEILHDYDEKICGIMNRRRYIENSLKLPGTVSRMAVNDELKVVGFGAVKEVAGDELMISPLYADNLEIACGLLSELLSSVPNRNEFSFLVIIYPEVNANVKRLLSTFSNNRFITKNEVRSQYTKKMFKLPLNNIFAVEECSHNPV